MQSTLQSLSHIVSAQLILAIVVETSIFEFVTVSGCTSTHEHMCTHPTGMLARGMKKH